MLMFQRWHLPILRPKMIPNSPPPPEKVDDWHIVDSEKKLQFKLINFFTVHYRPFANPEVE
jgi:hypothetical protein